MDKIEFLEILLKETAHSKPGTLDELFDLARQFSVEDFQTILKDSIEYCQVLGFDVYPEILLEFIRKYYCGDLYKSEQ